MTCTSCCTTISGDEDVIVCEGFCSNSFHIKCVGLSLEECISCMKNPHVFWICTACTKLLREVCSSKNMHDKFKAPASACSESHTEKQLTAVDTSDDIAKIKTEIAAIHKTLADLTSSRLSVGCASEQPLAHSSPTVSMKQNVMMGSRDVEESMGEFSRGIGNQIATVNDDKFWLFLTRIRNDVTVDEIRFMVADSLGADAVFVKKLVPHWKDASLLPYISFKIGIDRKFRNQAMSVSTWPKGLCFREFQERSDIWGPQR